MPHFECGTINHSATSPGANQGKSGPEVGASSRAFWSEVEAGSREQNASKDKESSPVLMQSEPIGLDTRKPGQTRRGGPKNFAVGRVEQEKVGPPDAENTGGPVSRH
jgi:hypothetical protein